MLVRKCDVCGRIIGDEVGYVVDIYNLSMPRHGEVRVKSKETSTELCYDCKQAMCGVLNERMTKYVLQGKEQDDEK